MLISATRIAVKHRNVVFLLTMKHSNVVFHLLNIKIYVFLSVSNEMVAKASTARCVRTNVICFMIQATNVQSHLQNEGIYHTEYCKNMFLPTLVMFMSMFPYLSL